MDRLVLAALLLAPRGSLTAVELAGRLWEKPPETSSNLLRDYIKKLRRHLDAGVSGAAALLPRYDGGYRMLAPHHRVDAHRFLDGVKDAQRLAAHDAERAAELYRGALSEWPSDASGPWGVEPLAGLPGAWAETERTALRNRHRETLMTCAEIEIRLGGHEQRLISELGRLLDAAPLDERAAELLMFAFVRAGRRGDALDVFHLIRERLLDELGSAPGPALARTLQRVLAEDPALTDPPPAPLGVPMSPTVHGHDDHHTGSGAHGGEAERELAHSAAGLVAETSRHGDTIPASEGMPATGEVLIGKLRERFEQDTSAEAALAWLVREPANAAALTALEGALLTVIVRDAAFAAELRTLVTPTPTPTQGQRGSVSIHAASINKSNVFTNRVKISGDFIIN